jgi:hypothetical protein
MFNRSSFDEWQHATGMSRRAALVHGGETGALASVFATLGRGRETRAQDATPMAAPAGWKAMHVEVSLIPHDPVTITLAGSGPPQRGDHFYIDAPIYAMGDENGSQVGTYQCFGAWTAAADDTSADNQRLTTVHYILQDGAIMGLINEAGADPNSHIGAVQGGSGAYAGAIGTFKQISRTGAPVGVTAPGATPAAAPNVVDGVFDLLLPAQG